MNQSLYKAPFVWIDMEMTGLNVTTDYILEIAAVCTNEQLEQTSPLFEKVIHVTESALQSMNDWCKKTHLNSGLCDAVRASNYSLETVTHELNRFLDEYSMNNPLLCGNTIWQDRIFLQAYLPTIEKRFHYRMIDVSSIKELVRRWYPDNGHLIFKKTDTHRAAIDIFESLEELRLYKRLCFK